MTAIAQTRLRTSFSNRSNGGINQVGKENGEQEENQGPPRRIEKAKPHGEQESREQNARRA